MAHHRTRKKPAQAALPSPPSPQGVALARSGSAARSVPLIAVGIALGVLGLFGAQALRPHPAPAASASAASKPIPTSYYDLLAMPPDELAKVDVALMNLLCAKGLPGADDLDIPAALAKIDEWAKRCPPEIERHLYRAEDPRYADLFQGSDNRVRIYLMVQVLQEDLGVRYNHERIYTPDFRDSRDVLIHGMLPGANGGTCASMPVLYTAVARRLGYPVKLVQAREHLFCRWDDGNERFNIEGAGEGLSFYPDEHYHTWPKPLSQADRVSGVFLTSMTPQQELANFLHDRGTCLHANGNLVEARAAFAESLRLEPRSANTFTALLLVCGARRGPSHGQPNPAADAWLRQMTPPDPQPGRPQQPWNPPVPGQPGTPNPQLGRPPGYPGGGG
jgi:hypothetical protein